MSCCGQKRAALTKALSTRTPVQAYTQPTPVQRAVQQDQAGTVSLRYLGTTTITLRGPSSGRVYYFDKAGALAIVQQNDAEALLRTRLFAHGE